MVSIPTNKRIGDTAALRHDSGAAPARAFELPGDGAHADAPSGGVDAGSGSLDHLGQKLGELRRAKGMTQIDVAARMGTTQPSLARLERNELNPNLRTLSRYAAAIDFDVRVTYTPKDSGAKAGKVAESDLESVPKKLAELRRESGLTQSAVAERLSNTQPVIARLESGAVVPNLRTLERYADVIGLRIDLQFHQCGK